jgi:hypothetical protein
VGKRVGDKLYVHKKYANEVIPNDVLKKAALILKQKDPTFRFNSIMWDMKTNAIRFDEAPDFDAAREPHVGQYVVVLPDGTTREGSSNNIWHHKWLWVKDDYPNFDVDKSVNWSRLWLSKVQGIAKGTDVSFGSQLKKYGLDENIEGIRFETDVRGFHHGQTDVTLYAKDQDGNILGNLDYTMYNGEIFIDYIHVNQKRKKIATALIKQLRKEDPETKINVGGTTPEGSKFFSNPEIKSYLKELEYPLAKKDELQSYEGMEGWKGKIVWMPPEKFLRLASPLPDYQMDEKSYWNLKHRMEKGLRK